MHRSHNRPSPRSPEPVLRQREGRPYCAKCQQFVKHKDAVWVGRRQCRCPACGELLERRVEEPSAPAAAQESAPAREQNRPA